MDETSAETLTSASTTNDKDIKRITDTGTKKGSKKLSSSLSKNDMEANPQSDVLAVVENKSPENKSSHPTNGDDKDEEKISQEENADTKSEESDLNTNEESLPNEVNGKCQKQSAKNETQKESIRELKVSCQKEEEERKTSKVSESPIHETLDLVQGKSNGHYNKVDDSPNTHKDKYGEDEDDDKAASDEKNTVEIKNDTETTHEESTLTIANEEDRCSPSTPTTSPEKEDTSKDEVTDKVVNEADRGNDPNQSNNIAASRNETGNTFSTTSNSTITDTVSSAHDESSVEAKTKDENYSVGSNQSKCDEKEKPQQTLREKECQKQLADRGKEKKTSDAKTICEGSTTGTRRQAEPHSSSLLNNSSKAAPSVAVAKLNTLEILSAKHLNDGSKFEIFKGLIEVGKMTNKEVVNAVLYLVRKSLIHTYISTLIF